MISTDQLTQLIASIAAGLVLTPADLVLVRIALTELRDQHRPHPNVTEGLNFNDRD